jgi:hypothetical protein
VPAQFEAGVVRKCLRPRTAEVRLQRFYLYTILVLIDPRPFLGPSIVSRHPNDR